MIQVENCYRRLRPVTVKLRKTALLSVQYEESASGKCNKFSRYAFSIGSLSHFRPCPEQSATRRTGGDHIERLIASHHGSNCGKQNLNVKTRKFCIECLENIDGAHPYTPAPEMPGRGLQYDMRPKARWCCPADREIFSSIRDGPAMQERCTDFHRPRRWKKYHSHRTMSRRRSPDRV